MERPSESPAPATSCPVSAPAPAATPGQLGASLLRPRGRQKRPDQWKRVVRKNCRIAGQEYVNTKGELVKPKQIGEACTCRMKCYVMVSIGM